MTQYNWTFDPNSVDPFQNALRLYDGHRNILVSVHKLFHTSNDNNFLIYLCPSFSYAYAPTIQEAIHLAEANYHDMTYSWGELGKPTVPYILDLKYPGNRRWGQRSEEV
jgi:hypothetical protein